jgi:hypothetical protein
MCAPIAVHLNDMREDGPQAPRLDKLVITVATSVSSVNLNLRGFPTIG